MRPGSHAPAAVVGARGFLGTALGARLEAAGVEVRRFTRTEPALVDGTLAPGLGDVATIYWAASRINPKVAEEHPERVAADEAHLRDVLGRLRAEGLAPRVVLLSSGGTVYGAEGAPFSERSPLRPAGAYGRAKARLEQLLADNVDGAVVVRISNAYGPGQAPAPGQGVIGHWLRAAAAGRPVTVYGDPGTARDYVAVDDVAEALSRLHGAPAAPAIVNVGSGRATSLAEVLDVVRDVVGRPDLDVRHEPARAFDVRATWLDVSLARQALGWAPRVSLHAGIEAMWEWLRGT